MHIPFIRHLMVLGEALEQDLGNDRLYYGQQCLVKSRAGEQLVVMNRPMMEGSRFGPQMNRSSSGRLCPLSPLSSPSSSSSTTCLRGLTANNDLFVHLKKKSYLNFLGDSPIILLILFFQAFAMQLICSIVTVGCFMAGIQDLSSNTHLKCYPHSVCPLSRRKRCQFPASYRWHAMCG